MNRATAGILGLGLVALLAVAAAPGCRSSGSKPADAKSAVAVLESKDGSKLQGRATFTSIGGGWVEFRVDIADVEPGLHAVHIHEFGDCSAPDGKSAGGHWNPTGKKHGRWGQPDGEFHLGDIGNIEVGADGKGHLVLTTDRWALGGGGMNDVVGKSIIVHSGGDDFTTQPTGAAGGRIGCGVIR